MTDKQAILGALHAFICQRPGLETGNYMSGPSDREGAKAYCAEVRSITKDLREAKALLRAVELAHGITAEHLLHAFKAAYSGRLSIRTELNKANELIPVLDYCTGQYWPTEYRRAVCAVCASALWTYYRESANADTDSREYGSLGEELRAKMRQLFGRSIQQRWFN